MGGRALVSLPLAAPLTTPTHPVSAVQFGEVTRPLSVLVEMMPSVQRTGSEGRLLGLSPCAATHWLCDFGHVTVISCLCASMSSSFKCEW